MSTGDLRSVASNTTRHARGVSNLAYQVLPVVQHLQTGLPDAIVFGEVVHLVECCAKALLSSLSMY